MNIHTVNEEVVSNKKTRRVGRGTGSGRGKTASRGSNGQGSRSGASMSPFFEGGQMPLARRIPKRGFNNKEFERNIESVTIFMINKKCGDVVLVTPDVLFKAGLIRKSDSFVKVIGNDKIEGKKDFKIHFVSAGAKKSIEDAGGQIDILPGKKPVVKNKMKQKTKKDK